MRQGERVQLEVREKIAKIIQRNLAGQATSPADTLFVLLSLHLLRQDEQPLTLPGLRKAVRQLTAEGLPALRLIDPVPWGQLEARCREAIQCGQLVDDLKGMKELTLRDWVSEKLNPAVEAACNEIEGVNWVATAMKGQKGRGLTYRLRWHRRIKEREKRSGLDPGPHLLQPRVQAASNPFVWRGAITEAASFFDRQREQDSVADFLRKSQNCQIVGPRLIGKTSLLRQIGRFAPRWQENAVVVHLDLQAPYCHTLSGWLRRTGRQFGWSRPPNNLVEFAEGIEEMLGQGRRPTLLLDEFEQLTLRPSEFTRDFLLTLSACGKKGMSMITTSRRCLSELTDPKDLKVSGFYNIFPLIALGPFAEADAADFVSLKRPGLPSFTPEERTRILAFAKGYPLALQVACFQILEAKKNGESLTAAMQKADKEMKTRLPTW